MRPTLDQMRHLIALDQTRNFTRAARQCHISQPPFSRSIRRLEELVGRRLVSRERGMVVLTPEGEAFTKAAREVLERVDEALHAARTSSSGGSRLRIGLNEYVYALLHPVGLDHFAQAHPGLLMQPMDRPELPAGAALLSRKLDLCFEVTGSAEAEILEDGLDSVLVYREPIVVALPAASDLAKTASVNMVDLAEQPLCLFTRESAPQFYDYLLHSFSREGMAPRVALEVSLLATMINAVRVNGTVGLVPSSVADEDHPGVVFLPLTGHSAPEVYLHLLWRRADASPLLNDFLNWVKLHIRREDGPSTVSFAGERSEAAR